MSTDIRTAALKQPVDIAEYLFRRLHEVGVRPVHGVPGDYNLVALDYIPGCGLNWVGNCNELNAGYAADGYARIKGIGALVTTFGVGELSALNAIAGSYAEYVPVVHIVGTPSTLSQANGMLLHHTLGNGDFRVFSAMSRNISCAVSELNDPMTAADLIDHAIRECYLQSRPVYITLPTDSVTKKVEGERLKSPLDLSFPPNDEELERFVVNEVLKLLHAAKKPVILVDACAIRHRALAETRELVTKSKLPTFVAPMGKSAVDETLPNYGGVYAGNGSHTQVREMVESSDLVLSIGAIKSDFNTSGFTYHTSQLSAVDFHSRVVKVKYAEYRNCRMNGVLRKVAQNLDLSRLSVQPVPSDSGKFSSTADNVNGQEVTHGWFWPTFSQWVRENDIIITETGTAGYGIWEVNFKKGVQAISQILWGSIGYATGSCQGAALAAKETGRNRTILFTGDGSFQLTAQELSTMCRKKLNPIIFVICNDGYTIERFIHGMKATYNDVAPWRYKDLVTTFGAEPGTFKTYQAKTKDDVLGLLKDDDFASSSCLRFVELYMKWDDAPMTLQMTAKAAAKNNEKQ